MLAPDRSHGAASTLGVCILAGCALLAAATFATADSSPRRQARTTHLGVAPKDIVTLVSSGNGTSLAFFRANADGTTDTSEFLVPAGYQLVVTDVDWTGSCTNTSSEVTLRIWVENKASPTTRRLGHVRFETLNNAAGSPFSTSSTGYGGKPNGMFAGFCVSSSARVTADVARTALIGGTATFGGANWSPTVILRGYLAVDE